MDFESEEVLREIEGLPLMAVATVIGEASLPAAMPVSALPDPSAADAAEFCSWPSGRTSQQRSAS